MEPYACFVSIQVGEDLYDTWMGPICLRPQWSREFGDDIPHHSPLSSLGHCLAPDICVAKKESYTLMS